MNMKMNDKSVHSHSYPIIYMIHIYFIKKNKVVSLTKKIFIYFTLIYKFT